MVNSIVINSAIRSTINSITQTQRLIDQTTLRLSTGKRVNSAIDDPKNYFTSLSLTNRANDFARLLDGINRSTRTIQEGLIGTEAISSLLNQAETIAIESQAKLKVGETDPANFTQTTVINPDSLSTQILAANPVAYWRLDDAGSPAVNLGSGGAAIDGTYTGGVTNQAPALYTNGATSSADFDGTNDIINIPDSNLINGSTYVERTVELTFNADDINTRQVLYEEGATVNGFTIYIDNGLIRVTGEDDQGGQRWADADISFPIVAGQTYHVAFVFDQPNDSFTGYVDGVNIGSVSVANGVFPSHGGNIGIGGAPDGVQFHDGESGAGGFFFDGRISDVAVYNDALSVSTLLSHAQSSATSNTTRTFNTNFNNVLDQIDQVTIDASYRGINLLANEDLTTNFNETHTNKLVTEGENFTSSALGIIRSGFDSVITLQETIDTIREAQLKVRAFGDTLTAELSIITTRSRFTEQLILTHRSGADDLVLADINEEGANQLANDVRQQLATTALSIAAESQGSVLRLFNS